jgi:myo-inositol catabolism protein IolC
VTSGWREPLFLRAFDHRASFERGLFGLAGPVTVAQADLIADAKQVIFEGFQQALADGVPARGGGVLVDEQYGAAIARHATHAGHLLAVPVERSGQDEFDFEYGAHFGEHIERFAPTFAKVLVRYNPDGDLQVNAHQLMRLRALSDWLRDDERRFLFELLVPALPQQIATVGGDPARFDAELRPPLVRRTIAELQSAGVEPDVWKIDGLDRREDCERIVEQARAGGRDDVACIVLGRGADEAAVVRWLQAGAGVPGYVGFAVGRTLWWDALVAYVGGATSRAEATSRIAANYGRMADAYAAAAGAR